jgi:hypothetical protein
MAFSLLRWTRVTAAFNSGAITTTLNPSTTPVISNGPAYFTYASATDNIAAIGAANYFADVIFDLAVDDVIYAQGSDAAAFYTVDALDRDAGTISVVSSFPSGVIGTANIQDLAVTNAKIANATITAAKLVLGTLTTGYYADGSITSPKLAANLMRYVAVPLTAANIIAMYAAPVSVLAAPAAGSAHIVESASLIMTYGTTQFTGGGNIGLQYGNTANLAGTAATAVMPSSSITGAASAATTVQGALAAAPLANMNAAALFISNATAAFATGDSTFVLELWYRTVTVV